MAATLTINAEHDAKELQQTFTRYDRLQVPNFLDAQSAHQVHQMIKQNKTWYLTYNEGQENYESESEKFNELQPEQQQRFMKNVYGRAKDNFQYIFKQYSISQAIKLGEHAGHPLHCVEDFVNSDKFLAFMRELTGRQEINHSDSYASCYETGHFLTEHNDIHDRQNRIAAWVISMTPDWNPNWGGYLAFFDDEGNIETAFKPSYNTLNIFSIPQKHAVQLVAPFAGQPRTSLLGWLQH